MNYLDKVYEKMAADTVESLHDEHLDLDRFLPALHREMLSTVQTMQKEAGDYEPDDLNWAANQEREAKLFLEGMNDAISNLAAALTQSLSTDDQIIVGRMKTAVRTLRNLKRRMEA